MNNFTRGQHTRLARVFNGSGTFIYTEPDENGKVWTTDTFMAVCDVVRPIQKTAVIRDGHPKIQVILDQFHNPDNIYAAADINFTPIELGVDMTPGYKIGDALVNSRFVD